MFFSEKNPVLLYSTVSLNSLNKMVISNRISLNHLTFSVAILHCFQKLYISVLAINTASFVKYIPSSAKGRFCESQILNYKSVNHAKINILLRMLKSKF